MPSKSAVLFKNVLIFDGKQGCDSLTPPSCVLVQDNKIVKISASEDGLLVPSDAQVVDGKGSQVLMPGLSDAHYHLVLASLDLKKLLDPKFDLNGAKKYVFDQGVSNAKELIEMGFTTVRDAGGMTLDLKQDIDSGKVVGPRVYPAGPFISQTSGHFDFRNPCCWLHDLSGNNPGPFVFPKYPTSPLSRLEALNMVRIVDGVPEMLRAVRENLMMGVTQIKIATGGGVSSMYDGVDVAQFTAEEIKACTDAASDYNTYVMTHCFTPRSIIRSIENGIKCIEHAMLMDEESAKLMADTGTWLSAQPMVDDEDAIFPEGSNPTNRAKWVRVTEGNAKTYELAKKYNIKTAFGTDTLFNPALVPKEGKMLTKLVTFFGFTPAEALVMATSTNAELFKMCGPRDPYAEATFGTVAEGCYADLILVEGNPLEDIHVIANRDNIKVVMKDGTIYKNIL